jgi:hypothetical protein
MRLPFRPNAKKGQGIPNSFLLTLKYGYRYLESLWITLECGKIGKIGGGMPQPPSQPGKVLNICGTVGRLTAIYEFVRGKRISNLERFLTRTLTASFLGLSNAK